jgi:hypothetical protein
MIRVVESYGLRVEGANLRLNFNRRWGGNWPRKDARITKKKEQFNHGWTRMDTETKAPPLPSPMASQARHESVSRKGTFAPRIVVPHSVAERERKEAAANGCQGRGMGMEGRNVNSLYRYSGGDCPTCPSLSHQKGDFVPPRKSLQSRGVPP